MYPFPYSSSPRNSPVPHFHSTGTNTSYKPSAYADVFASDSYAPDDWMLDGLPRVNLRQSPPPSPHFSPISQFDQSLLPSPSPLSFMQPPVVQEPIETFPTLQLKGRNPMEYPMFVPAHLLPPPLEEFQIQPGSIGRIPTTGDDDMQDVTDDSQSIDAYSATSSSPSSNEDYLVSNTYVHSQNSRQLSSTPSSPNSNDDTRSYASPSSDAGSPSDFGSPVQSPHSPFSIATTSTVIPPAPVSLPRRAPRRTAAATITTPPKPKSRAEKRARSPSHDSVNSADSSEEVVENEVAEPSSKKLKSNLETLQIKKKDRLTYTTSSMDHTQLSGKLGGFTQLPGGAHLFAVERISTLVDGGEKKEIVLQLKLKLQKGELALPVHLRLRAFKSGGKCTNSMIVHETEFCYGDSMYTVVFVFECRNSYKRGSAVATYIGNNDEEGLWFRYQSQPSAASTDQDGISLHAPKYCFKTYVREESLQFPHLNPVLSVESCTASVNMWSKESDAQYIVAEGFEAKVRRYTQQPPTALLIRDVKTRKN